MFAVLSLNGCVSYSRNAPPIAQQMQVQQVDKQIQKTNARRYLCNDNQIVRVVETKPLKQAKKTLSRVTVTFNEVSEKLTQSISERGKNYANIRWHWLERDDFSTLTTAVGTILAEHCELQQDAQPNAN